ncbi:MAG: VWA domain-containing protein [Acidobacteriia bacterium]|nr:VWA domain-containing protein [Terriglobia bacterium]
MNRQGALKTILMLASLGAASGQDATFRTETRLVEVYATVRDHSGRYMDGLPRERFEVRDNGQAQALVAFESNASSLSCAILLDTTGSMADVLPVVKNSIIKLIDAMSDGDSVAIFGFANGLNRLQEFTTDKASAKQAVLRTRAAGATALFDAISEVAREISPRSGKKALVVFTDGQDNASLLNAERAIQRAKKAGVPVYTIAEGDALKTKDLLKELKDISEGTGAVTFEARRTKDIVDIFQDISGDLRHTYLLAYKPPPDTSQRWRTIQLNVVGVKDAKIRAKEGYLPE